jgi:circadian clock protein KaiB
MTDDTDEPQYELTLFVSGTSALSERAIASARELCDVHLAGRARLAVVDVHEAPDAVERHELLATPSLVRTSPQPPRRIVGSLSDTTRVLEALGIRAEATP